MMQNRGGDRRMIGFVARGNMMRVALTLIAGVRQAKGIIEMRINLRTCAHLEEVVVHEHFILPISGSFVRSTGLAIRSAPAITCIT